MQMKIQGMNLFLNANALIFGVAKPLEKIVLEPRMSDIQCVVTAMDLGT